MPAALWSLKPSPWSVRVRWALKVLNFDFKVIPFPDWLAEWRLRFLLRKWRVSVPVLVDKKVIEGAMDIVTHAQAQMRPDGLQLMREGVEDWARIADVIMENERYVRCIFYHLRLRFR
jgi:glutathione S-transferase